MWRGDVVHAVLVYPLGPILFLAMIFTMLDAALVVAGHQGIRLPIHLTRGQKWGMIVLVVVRVCGQLGRKTDLARDVTSQN